MDMATEKLVRIFFPGTETRKKATLVTFFDCKYESVQTSPKYFSLTLMVNM